jgi:uncharacterized Tic20 family protein
MEIISENGLRYDKNLLVITHLTQLLNFISGFGGLVVPLILWLTSKDKVVGMEEHGRAAVNLQLSLILYGILSIPAILLLGLGILTLIGVGILGLVLPILNAVRASNGESPSYFLTISFIQGRK